MEPNFTPGPWRVEATKGVQASYTLRNLCGLMWRQSVENPNWHGSTERYISPRELDANVHLIAAAPDLYAAAKRALAVLKAQGESVRPGNALGALEEALRKARGEAA